MKSKKERITTIITQIIHESSCLLEIIETSCSYSQMFQLVINHEQSCGSKDDRRVILGLEHLKCLYELCLSFLSFIKKNNITLESNIILYADYEIKDFCIDTFELKEEELNKTCFLCNEIPSSVDLLVIYALASSLYHEFGHVKYDKGPSSVSNEMKADEFAFRIVHDKCNQKNVEKSPEFLGLLLDYIMILHLFLPNDKRGNTHPHPIERLYTLLDHFAISDDSYIWEFVYYNVYGWVMKNKVEISNMPSSSLGNDGLKNLFSQINKY